MVGSLAMFIYLWFWKILVVVNCKDFTYCVSTFSLALFLNMNHSWKHSYLNKQKSGRSMLSTTVDVCLFPSCNRVRRCVSDTSMRPRPSVRAPPMNGGAFPVTVYHLLLAWTSAWRLSMILTFSTRCLPREGSESQYPSCLPVLTINNR